MTHHPAIALLLTMAPPFRCTSGTTGSPSRFHGTAGSLPCSLGSILVPLAVGQHSYSFGRPAVLVSLAAPPGVLPIVDTAVAEEDRRSYELHSQTTNFPRKRNEGTPLFLTLLLVLCSTNHVVDFSCCLIWELSPLFASPALTRMFPRGAPSAKLEH